MTLNVTLLDLVNAVSDHARSDAEAIATVVYMVNSGRVQLCGTFKGAHFDLATLGAGLAAVRPEPDRRAELMNHAVMEAKRLFVAGQLVEYWEDPDLAFGWTREDLQGYLERSDWVLLFNALVLTAPRPEPGHAS